MPGRQSRLRFVALVALIAIWLSASAAGCKRPYGVGDHVLVEWEGNVYPAMIIGVESATKFKVHYDGYDALWDEVVPRERVRGLVEGSAVSPEPPAKVRAKAVSAAQTSVYRVGDRVRVEWHGQMYPAIVSAIVGQDRYRIHYEGYGTEWDETVGLSRIQPKQ